MRGLYPLYFKLDGLVYLLLTDVGGHVRWTGGRRANEAVLCSMSAAHAVCMFQPEQVACSSALETRYRVS